MFPDADSDRLAQIARETDLQIVAARLDSPNRLAHFFGQVEQEVGPGLRLVESLNYRADRLGSIFRYFSRNPDEALLFNRTADQPADQEAIANRAYDLFALADTGISGAAADSITEIINPGTDSYSQRWENVQNLSGTEVFANICRFSVARPRFEDAE